MSNQWGTGSNRPAWWLRALERAGLVEMIYGKDREHDTLYLLRFKLTPDIGRGQLFLHVFYRGDEDPSPHDHPWAFWTCPLNMGYYEEVMDGQGLMHLNWVRCRRWTRRDWSHVHRVMGGPREWPLYTLVWRGPVLGVTWGFWVDARGPERELLDNIGWHIQSNPTVGNRVKMPWRSYVFGERQVEAI